MGGEKSSHPQSVDPILGSPPRRRGKGLWLVSGPVGPGITPAWAGKSSVVSGSARCARDHPRVGGEKFAEDRGGNFVSGSPPRGRGKVPPCAGLPPLLRITPAWAGKSQAQRLGLDPVGDHPRVGGEKAFQLGVLGLQLGSPPRGRGKAFPEPLPLLGRGITPAWAGKRKIRAEFAI